MSYSPFDSPDVRAWKEALVAGANEYLERERAIQAHIYGRRPEEVKLIYNVMVDSEESATGECSLSVTVELLGDDNPELDLPSGPHHLKLAQSAAEDPRELRLDVIDARVREWIRKIA